MIAILKILMMLSGSPKTIQEPYTHVCNRDFTNLSLETKLELSIGCSEVNGGFAYSNSKLNRIFEDDATFRRNDS